MTAWAALYEQHGAMRATSADLMTALRRRLIDLADRGHLNPTIQGRFTRRNRGALRELFIDAEGGGEPLANLPDLRDARLTVLALISRRNDRLHQFTAMIEGTTESGLPWAAAVHLEDDSAEDDRKGDGACGHAAFHCHVGPTLDHPPKVRVPFPAVGPAGALDWLLAIVVPSWEPAPWPDIVATRDE